MFHRVRFWHVNLMLVASCSISGARLASGAPGTATGTPWVTGAAIEKRLTRPINIVWSGNPLRQAIDSLSHAQEVAMLLDRRVDPSQKLELKLDQVPLGAALHKIAERQALGVSLLGSVVYFGPPAAASRLRTLAAVRGEEVGKLPPAVARKFLQLKAIAWPDFATPRELLQQWAKQNSFTLEGLEQVPHDLWAAADLPAMSLVDRLTLTALQFDLTFTIGAGGKTVRLLPIPDDLALTRTYEGGHEPGTAAARFAAIAPTAKIQVVGSKIRVRGLLEDHERIAAPRPTAAPAANREHESVADLSKIHIDKMSVREIPARQVLEQLAKKLNLDLRIDEKALAEAGVSLDERVSLSVQNVTVDELLRQVTAAAHVQFHRRGNVLEIGPETAVGRP
jgi:hypothetical protein